MSDEKSPRAEQAFSGRAGEAWVLLQEQTDALIDPFGLRAMEALSLQPGERVLDVGCGCGQTLLELADVVGSAGRVLGVDISEPMLERARQRTQGRPTISLCLADAQRHSFSPPPFDAAFSRFGVMFFDDAGAAFANLAGALRAGGRLAFVCWQDMALNPWAAVPLRAVLRVVGEGALPDLMKVGRPGPFYFSDPDRVRGFLAAGGFSDVRIERDERPVHLGGARTLEEAVAYCRQIGPAARATADADPALRPALDRALGEALAPFVGERGVWMDAAAFIVTARKA